MAVRGQALRRYTRDDNRGGHSFGVLAGAPLASDEKARSADAERRNAVFIAALDRYWWGRAA